jgi:pimeloyl-ACP methyl ester carboxylesterase
VGTDQTVDRFEVRAPDGVPIAVWQRGRGPALVMVHGSIADHTTFDSFVAVLGDACTTFALDRRGFGDSGDAPGYSLERDFDDVAAVVDAVADRTGGPVGLFGHSYGAGCVLGGAARAGRRVSHVVAYEPGLGLAYPPGAIDRIEGLVAAGDADGAITAVLADVLGLDEDEIAAFRASPLWPRRLAAAPTIPRECRVEEAWHYEAGQFDGITARTLFLTGSQSVPDIVEATRRAAAAVPGAEVRVLEGHAHFAHRADPSMVTALIRDFLAS